MDPITLNLKYGPKTIRVEQDADGNWIARGIYHFEIGTFAGKCLKQTSKPYKTERGAIKAAQAMAEASMAKAVA